MTKQELGDILNQEHKMFHYYITHSELKRDDDLDHEHSMDYYITHSELKLNASFCCCVFPVAITLRIAN